MLLGSEWQAATRWRMRLTGQYKRTHAEEEGLMLALQGSYRPTESIKLSLLGGYFATTSFAARTYLYVPRVRYTRMRSMFYGKGINPYSKCHHNDTLHGRHLCLFASGLGLFRPIRILLPPFPIAHNHFV